MKPLSEAARLYDWEGANEDTQYATHGIHRYSGKFIPQIARNAIELLTKKDDLILDVYAGSGTTLLESCLQQRNSIGIDLNPLAVLISKVKTTPISRAVLNMWMADFTRTIQQYEVNSSQHELQFSGDQSAHEPHRLVECDRRTSDPWYTKWFQSDALRELIWIDLNIKGITDDNIRNVAMVALSDILRKSSNAHSSYPNVMFDKNKKMVGPVVQKYIKRLTEIVENVACLEGMCDSKYLPSILEGNNTCLPMDSGSVDAIITHPPYIGSVPYAEYGVLSLTWLNQCPKALDAVLTGGQRQRKSVVERFFADYAKMFLEAHRVLKGGKYMFILVGSPTVRGEKIDLTAASIKYAEEAKFRLDTELTRKGVNRRANLMGEESMLFFRK